MKYLKYLAVFATMLLAGSCAQPDDEFAHTDVQIKEIYISSDMTGVTVTVTGTIDQQTGEILFPIRKSVKDKVDKTRLKVRANVPYDVRITPSLSGLKDLTDPYAITVRNTQTGETKNYTLQAFDSPEM